VPVSDDTLAADLRATAEAVASGWPIVKLAEAKRRGPCADPECDACHAEDDTPRGVRSGR
jgi:hypothetical protein